MNTAELSPKFQARLKATLLPEEKVQWFGQSQPFPLICQENRTALIVRWIVCAICAVVLSVVYAVWIKTSGNSYNVVLEIAILLAFTYVGILVPILDRNNLLKQTLYCITDKRVLVLVADRAPVALNRAGLKTRLVSSENDCIHILFGASVNTKPRRYRPTAISPHTDKTGDIYTGAVFYHIQKADIPEDILPFS